MKTIFLITILAHVSLATIEISPVLMLLSQGNRVLKDELQNVAGIVNESKIPTNLSFRSLPDESHNLQGVLPRKAHVDYKAFVVSPRTALNTGYQPNQLRYNFPYETQNLNVMFPIQADNAFVVTPRASLKNIYKTNQLRYNIPDGTQILQGAIPMQADSAFVVTPRTSLQNGFQANQIRYDVVHRIGH